MLNDILALAKPYKIPDPRNPKRGTVRMIPPPMAICNFPGISDEQKLALLDRHWGSNAPPCGDLAIAAFQRAILQARIEEREWADRKGTIRNLAVGELRARLGIAPCGISSVTLNRYCKLANVATPKRGKKNHTFTPDEIRAVCRAMAGASDSTMREAAGKLLAEYRN